MFTQLQQYQQPQQAAVTGRNWNGSSWTVSPANPSSSSLVNSSTYPTSYYSSGQQQPAPGTTVAASNQSSNVIPPDPVATFTKYYHGWQKVVKEHEAYVRTLHPGTPKEEAERHLGWARYYGDQASRAAHFFYQNPGATSAPFDIPPAPSSDGQTATPNTSATTNPSYTGAASPFLLFFF